MVDEIVTPSFKGNSMTLFPNMYFESWIWFQVMDFIEQMTSSHKQEIVDSGEDIEGWMEVFSVS